MPANLPPDYYAAERRYREASDPREKVAILREMLAIMPKHKGTDHLQGDLKRRIAKLQSEAQKKQATSHTSGFDHIPREGAGQVVLVGGPNTGKSALVSALTHVDSPVASYPFSTFRPYVGMMPFEDIQIQIVDLPPLSPVHTEPWVFNVLRLADVLLLFVDGGGAGPQEELERLMALLREHHIEAVAQGEARPQGPVAHKTTLIGIAKADHPQAVGTEAAIRQVINGQLPLVSFSVQGAPGTDGLGQTLFSALDVVRVYTKQPGKRPDIVKPYVLPAGATVEEAAATIHRELAQSMTYARIWAGDKVQGLRVERHHPLTDGDILEIHWR